MLHPRLLLPRLLRLIQQLQQQRAQKLPRRAYCRWRELQALQQEEQQGRGRGPPLHPSAREQAMQRRRQNPHPHPHLLRQQLLKMHQKVQVAAGLLGLESRRQRRGARGRAG